jgi:hypothetical protein
VEWRADWPSQNAARRVDQLWAAIATPIDTFTPQQCANYFAAAGYDAG